jgi:Spy/CpxP family protein refolding chaperone
LKKKLTAMLVALALALSVLLGTGQAQSEQANVSTSHVQLMADGGGNASPPGSG